jgi:hypothetical protein
MKAFLLFFLLLLGSQNALAMGLAGRLGIGMSNQVVSGIDTLSFKLHRNRSTALGALFGIDNSSDASNYAVGGKYYKNIYDEPQLNFYSAFSAIMFTNQNSNDKTINGSQYEALFGTEFSFQGLESIGFSFEFGIGLIDHNGENSIKTTGYNTIVSAVHFYL